MKNLGISLILTLSFALGGCGKDDDKGSTSKPSADKKAPPATKPPATKPPATKPPATKPPAAAAEKLATVKIDAYGYQFDAPESWKGKQLNELAFTMDIKSVKVGSLTVMPTFTIVKMPTMSKGLDKAAEKCRGKVVDKKQVDGGAFYYVCELEAAGQKLLDLYWFVPLDKGGLRCGGSGADIALQLAACKSLRTI